MIKNYFAKGTLITISRQGQEKPTRIEEISLNDKIKLYNPYSKEFEYANLRGIEYSEEKLYKITIAHIALNASSFVPFQKSLVLEDQNKFNDYYATISKRYAKHTLSLEYFASLKNDYKTKRAAFRLFAQNTFPKDIFELMDAMFIKNWAKNSIIVSQSSKEVKETKEERQEAYRLLFDEEQNYEKFFIVNNRVLAEIM